jgi:hypothetical protein
VEEDGYRTPGVDSPPPSPEQPTQPSPAVRHTPPVPDQHVTPTKQKARRRRRRRASEELADDPVCGDLLNLEGSGPPDNPEVLCDPDSESGSDAPSEHSDVESDYDSPPSEISFSDSDSPSDDNDQESNWWPAMPPPIGAWHSGDVLLDRPPTPGEDGILPGDGQMQEEPRRRSPSPDPGQRKTQPDDEEEDAYLPCASPFR